MPSASGEGVSESDTPFQLKLFMGAQMRSRGYTWSLVLAGGEGSRLRSLITDGTGAPVPKQFCSLFGATTLLEDAPNRGRAVADGGRVCAIVADHHHRWWCKAALWNSFIFAVRGAALLELYRRRHSTIVDAMDKGVHVGKGRPRRTL
jgi:hypothetical protein